MPAGPPQSDKLARDALLSNLIALRSSNENSFPRGSSEMPSFVRVPSLVNKSFPVIRPPQDGSTHDPPEAMRIVVTCEVTKFESKRKGEPPPPPRIRRRITRLPYPHSGDGETGAAPLGVSTTPLAPTPAPGLTQPADLASLSLASQPESPHSTASTSTTSLGSWVVVDDDQADVAREEDSAEKSGSCLDSESLRRHATCPLFSTRMSGNTAALLGGAQRPDNNLPWLQRMQTQLESRIETQIVPAAIQPMPPFAPMLPTRRITVAPSMPSTSSPPIARQMQAMMAS